MKMVQAEDVKALPKAGVMIRVHAEVAESTRNVA